MHYWGFGMHLFWWIFWILLIVGFFALLTPISRRRAHLYRTPLEILQRRYAAGEITTEEYEERKMHLERDSLASSTSKT